MSDDTVVVQPVRTLLEGRDLVHPESEPYPVLRSRMLESRRNGLVVHVEGEPAPAEPASPKLAAPAPKVDPAPPVLRAEPDSPAPPWLTTGQAGLIKLRRGIAPAA